MIAAVATAVCWCRQRVHLSHGVLLVAAVGWWWCTRDEGAERLCEALLRRVEQVQEDAAAGEVIPVLVQRDQAIDAGVHATCREAAQHKLGVRTFRQELEPPPSVGVVLRKPITQ